MRKLIERLEIIWRRNEVEIAVGAIVIAYLAVFIGLLAEGIIQP